MTLSKAPHHQALDARSAALLGLLNDVAAAATEADTPRAVLSLALDRVRSFAGCAIGHAYIWNPDARLLVPSELWRTDDPERYEKFRLRTCSTRFSSGEGLPGRVLADERPHWIVDVRNDTNFPRRDVAGEVGVRSAMAFPVRTRDGVVAVLEFFTDRIAQPDEPLLAMMTTVGSLVGRVFERVQAEAVLRERESRFRALAENAAEAIVTIDHNDHIIFANRSVSRVFGYSLDEITEMHFSELMPERFRDKHRAGLRRLVETGERRIPWDGIELPGLRRDGLEVPLEITFGEFHRSGEYFFTGIMRDISERKRAEAEHAELLADSERRRIELQDVIDSRSRLVRGFSHDVKNPLGAANGFLQLLQKGIKGDLTAAQLEAIDHARRLLGTALGLIDDLLDLARAEAGQLELRIGPTDLPQTAHELTEEFRAQAQAAELDVVCVTDEDVPIVESDPDRVRQVVSNLLSNAVKYTQSGGSILVHAGIAHQAGRALVEVSDTGPGIPPEKRELIFQEFARLDDDPEKGAGVGLAISRRIARALGGDIELESEPGRGSTFTFWLPLR